MQASVKPVPLRTRVTCALLGAWLAMSGCAGAAPEPQAPHNAPEATQGHEGVGAPIAPFEIPASPGVVALPRQRVATGLRNPRGMHVTPTGVLWVSEAGTGDPANPNTGRLLALSDVNGDGDYDDEGERRALLDAQPSKNILGIVRRDEVFGMAGMAEGAGQVLVSRAFFGGPTTIFRIGQDGVTPWGSTHGNINDLAFDPPRGQWLGVASTTDEVVRLIEGGLAERVVKIPPLPNGQDPVPGYLRYDPVTGKILVSLFTGSPEGEEGGEGTELVPRAGGLIAVDPEARSFEWYVRGLSVPTDFEITPDGSIYVLEFCKGFLDPTPTRESLYEGASHGGFQRYSGRLLRIARPGGEVTVVAEGLDAPTNVTVVGNTLLVAQGMGTPGRLIPTPNGDEPLSGFIERIALP